MSLANELRVAELTPAQARALAASLMDMSDAAEEHIRAVGTAQA